MKLIRRYSGSGVSALLAAALQVSGIEATWLAIIFLLIAVVWAVIASLPLLTSHKSIESSLSSSETSTSSNESTGYRGRGRSIGNLSGALIEADTGFDMDDEAKIDAQGARVKKPRD